MPNWLIKQLKQAFRNRDRYQIRFLNQCWFDYQSGLTKKISVKP